MARQNLSKTVDQYLLDTDQRCLDAVEAIFDRVGRLRVLITSNGQAGNAVSVVQS